MARILVGTNVIVDSVAFVEPAAKQTLLEFVDATPVTLEKDVQHALAVLQSASSLQIAPSSIVPVDDGV